MGQDEQRAADWKDAAAYAPLLDVDRSIFAWEWLRRDPGYRAAARAAFERLGSEGEAPGPAFWGLHAFEDPELAAPRARPLWRAAVHPYVLQAVAAPSAEPADALDLSHFAPLATMATSAAGHEHLFLSDGLRAIRLDVLAGRLEEGPVHLSYLLAGFASAEAQLMTLRRLLALRRTGRFSRSLHAREARVRRWLLTLRAHDALAGGADQREIASVLLSPQACEPHWRSQASSIRSQAQRLVRNARRMAAGGYRALLR